jgi:hypothetical protein
MSETQAPSVVAVDTQEKAVEPEVVPVVPVPVPVPETTQDPKRKRDEETEAEVDAETSTEAKKPKTEEEIADEEAAAVTAAAVKAAASDDPGPAPVLASKVGTTVFGDSDVLSGRGGGTNVHPGNRNFRDLINVHRRAYLKARKNDKPAISRAIVRSVREANGAFLKKDEKSGLWFEIGDDAAREKTSQALRQRAPEMRKLLFDTEREEARYVAEEHLRQQRMLMGMGGAMPNMPPGMQMSPNGMFPNPALMVMASKNGMNGMNMPNMPQGGLQGQDNPYSQMFSTAMMQNGMNRFTPNA